MPSEKSSASYMTPAFASPGRRLWREIQRVLCLAAAVHLLLALVSHSPEDFSWSTYSTSFRTQNWLGRTGSVVSDALFQAFGLGAFLLVLFMFKSALEFRPAIKDHNPKLRPLFASLLLIAVSACLTIFLPTSWLPFKLHAAGGLVGDGLFRMLKFMSGIIGAKTLSLVFALVASILYFDVHPITWLLSQFPAWNEKMKLGIAAFWSEQAAKWNGWKSNRSEKKAQEKLVSPVSPALLPKEKTEPKPEKKSLLKSLIALPKAKPAEPAKVEEDVEIEDDPSDPTSIPMDTVLRNESDDEISKALGPKAKKAKAAPVNAKSRGAGEFELPPLSLLSGRADAPPKVTDRNWFVDKGNILVQKLRDFGVEGEVVHISPGPVITVYEFKPASGVKIKDIANLSDDLTLALSVMSVRIVAPIPGKPVVGIEIPSPHRETVYFKDMIEETRFYDPDMKIPLVLGRLASGDPIIAGLAAMPHLLVAGSTGTGKSVFINSLICSLLYRYTPKQLKLILVDPKMVELASYEGIPHLMLPVVVDSKKASLALRWVVDEMERRYTSMHKMGVRHLEAFNDKLTNMSEDEATAGGFEPMPYIVVIIDEYADLMAVSPKEVELSIMRLAQKARASGIHLVLATQRPSTDVVTGTIKANFPSRISFRVASAVDAKTILDRTGSERLLGNGDMLLHSAGFTSLKRMQGAFLKDAEIDRVTQFLKEQGEPQYDERIMRYQEEAMAKEDGGDEGGEGGGEGNLYDQAVRLVTDKGEASISLIQRHLKIGYNRAASLMEQMEKEGVVAPSNGQSKRRQVLVNSL